MTPDGPEPIGRYLARQRRLRGLTLDELAAAAHLPRRSLERLEAGAFDAKPDGFARGFVRTVAEAIGLDPEETVTRMLAEARPAGALGPRVPPGLVLAALVVALLASLLLSLPAWRGAPDAEVAAPETLPRRDFVRELAERSRGPVPPTEPGEGAGGDVPAAEAP